MLAVFLEGSRAHCSVAPCGMRHAATQQGRRRAASFHAASMRHRHDETGASAACAHPKCIARRVSHFACLIAHIACCVLRVSWHTRRHEEPQRRLARAQPRLVSVALHLHGPRRARRAQSGANRLGLSSPWQGARARTHQHTHTLAPAPAHGHPRAHALSVSVSGWLCARA